MDTIMLLLLSRWPLVCAVWPNYEVVVFQLWFGTAPNLGSISNITYKLNPAPLLSTFFWVFHFPSPSVYLCLPHPPPFYWASPLFFTYSPPSLLVLDLLSTWENFRSWWPPPPVYWMQRKLWILIFMYMTRILTICIILYQVVMFYPN